MELNVITPKLQRIVWICHAPTSGKEREKAEFVQSGQFDLSLTFMWLLHLAESNKYVDAKVRTPGVRLAAKEALIELAPLVVFGAENGNVCLKAWKREAMTYLQKGSKPPRLQMASEDPKRAGTVLTHRPGE